ncbi:PREDICTED: uncharacterized protein LOC106311180 isoform X2 [Brassica oleracea var. oleracea]|uniref:uncharacterized protein LOC106311180 isoform X2 n=1 Tax=Brassica oleracea var. oleracea TaxID=109376 RepID=UPI0006A702A7|nr:PREDICTED: uncharacterized protein LOC106311180 isoform X2 [Brassica oleracea var. oleracea]
MLTTIPKINIWILPNGDNIRISGQEQVFVAHKNDRKQILFRFLLSFRKRSFPRLMTFRIKLSLLKILQEGLQPMFLLAGLSGGYSLPLKF